MPLLAGAQESKFTKSYGTKNVKELYEHKYVSDADWMYVCQEKSFN